MHNTGQGVHDQAALMAAQAKRLAALERAMSNLGIAAGSVGTLELADLSVTNAKLAALAVTGAKIANSTITNANLAADAYNTGRIIARSNSGLNAAIVTGSDSDCFPQINFGHVAGRTYRFFSRIRAVKSQAVGSAVGGRVSLYINGSFITDQYFDSPFSSAAWYSSNTFDYLWDATTTGTGTFKTTVLAYTNNLQVWSEGTHYVQDCGPT